MKKHELNRNKPFIYIFDLNEILIDRFPSRIAKALNNIEGDSEYNFVFLYAEKYDNKKANPVKIPRNSILYFDKHPQFGRTLNFRSSITPPRLVLQML